MEEQAQQNREKNLALVVGSRASKATWLCQVSELALDVNHLDLSFHGSETAFSPFESSKLSSGRTLDSLA